MNLINRFLCKHAALALLLLCFCFSASAQSTKDKPHVISVSAGVSFPIGGLGGSFSFGGFEGIRADELIETGTIYMVSYAGTVHKNLALGATFGQANNNINVQAITDATNVSITSDPWKTTFATGDLYLLAPIRKLTLYAKGSGGFVLPQDFELYVTDEAGNGTLRTTDSLTPSFNLAGGLTFSLGNLLLGVETGFIGSRPGLEYRYVYEGEGSFGRFKQYFATQHASVKLGFRF